MKITPEIEAVARAIFYHDWYGKFDDLTAIRKRYYYESAIAAIRALRRPTDVMLDAGHECDDWGPSVTYKAMIDAALGENE